MAKATLSLSKKANPQGEHPILVRLDITRTNRPQFKSTVTVLPEYFADGEIKIPMRGKLNAAFRDELLKKKTDIEAFIASLTAISMALPEEARTRKDILEVYEVVKSVNPAEISRTTIIAKKKEQTAANAELVRQLQEARRPGVLDFVRKRLEGMKNGTIKRKGNNYTKQTLHAYTGFANILETFIKQHPFDWEDINERLIDEFVLYMENYGYMKKTINKNLAVFSAMLNTAFKEGFRFKTSVLDHFPKLHVTREDKVVEIYLTEEELQALYEMPLSGKEDKARDVFLVGCYTSQRFSDYSRITERNISFHDGVGIITLTQQKTGTEVSIPILNEIRLQSAVHPQQRPERNYQGRSEKALRIRAEFEAGNGDKNHAHKPKDGRTEQGSVQTQRVWRYTRTEIPPRHHPYSTEDGHHPHVLEQDARQPRDDVDKRAQDRKRFQRLHQDKRYRTGHQHSKKSGESQTGSRGQIGTVGTVRANVG